MAAVAEHLPLSTNDRYNEFEALLATWRELDAPDGYRVEISEGAIRMNALPLAGHSKIVAFINRVLVGCAPPGTAVFPLAGVLAVSVEKLYIPDLVVAAVDALAEDSMLDPTDVLIAVEVTSPSNARVDREEKPAAYAQAGVSRYLLVDRVGRNPTATLYADPVDGEYQHVVKIPFGESLHLPAPFDVDLDTAQFPR